MSGATGSSLTLGVREDAYCVEEFLRKVTAWEGSAEDELAEAIEAAEKLTAALDPDPAGGPEHVGGGQGGD